MPVITYRQALNDTRETTANFRAILRWNQSDFFGLAVGILSDRIAA